MDSPSDPLGRRGLKHFRSRACEEIQFRAQRLYAAFGLAEGCAKCARPLALADEFHEVGDSALLTRQGQALLIDLLRDVGQQLLHVLLDPGEDRREHLWLTDPVAEGSDHAPFDQLPGHEQPIRARALRAAEAPVVAAGLSADLSHGCAAASTPQHPGEEMGWMGLDVTPLLLLKSPRLTSGGPGSIDLHPSNADALLDVLRHDPQCLVLDDVPLVVRLGDATLTACPGVAASLGTVPGPPADVLFVLQDPTEGRWSPAEARSPAARNALFVQLSDDRRERFARREVAEDPPDDFGLGRVGHHPVAVRAWPPAPVDFHLANGLGPVSVRGLSDAEAPGLLAELSAESLLAQIVQVQLVDDAPHLKPELRVSVLAVEAVGARDDPDTVEAQLCVQGEQKVVVARQPGEVIDQYSLELAVPRRCAECLEAGAVAQRAGFRFVAVYVGRIDGEPPAGREHLAASDLIVDALGALVL